MKLEDALKGMFHVQNEIRTPRAMSDPLVLSKQMMRLSQYAGAVDERLAEYQQDYELQLARAMQYLIGGGMKPTPAEASAKMELAEVKSQIVYLDKVTQSAWRQVGVIQSRINHLSKERAIDGKQV